MNENTIVGIYGASGFGKEVLPLVRESLKERDCQTEICFIDDDCHLTKLSGINVCTYKEFFNIPNTTKQCVLAIADSGVREKLTHKLANDNVDIIDVSASNIVVMDDVELGSGSILCPFITLTSNIRIGKSFHCNIYSYVAHDCVIGDFVTFAPGVMCNGNVIIEDHAYLGTGALLKQGSADKPLVIGAGAVVGMGAVVTKDVPPRTTVVGNPARPLVR